MNLTEKPKQKTQILQEQVNHALGHHWLIELYSCKANLLEEVNFVEEHMERAAVLTGATIVQSNFHQFSPYGVSGVVVIQESHLTIHTWPEYAYAAIDLFTCGDTIQPEAGIEYLKSIFEAEEVEVKYLQRGFAHKLKKGKS